MRKNNLFLISLILCFSLLLSSCGKYKPIEPSEEDLTVVGQVAGMDVFLEELRFVAYTYGDILTNRYGEDIFEGDDAEKYLDLLKELVYASLTEGYATRLLCEDAYINLGEAIVLERVNQSMAETVEELGGMQKYKKYLKENHLTDHFLRYTTELQILEKELLYVYVDDIDLIENDDEKIYDIIKDEFLNVRHIFIPHSEEEAKDTLSEVLSRLDKGESFETLLSEYGKDPDMTDKGLLVPRGYMTEEYEDVALALAPDEYSSIVEDDIGFYVIERMEISPSDIMLQFDYLKNLYQLYELYSIIDEKQDTLTFVPNDAAENYMRSPFK